MLRVALLLGCVIGVGMCCMPRFCALADEPAVAQETVELFAAVADGKIAVEVIAKSPHEANLFVTNKSGKPLSVQMPKAIAASPVLAQFNQVPQFNNNNQNNKIPQTIGAGFPPMFGQNNNMQQNNFLQQNNRQGNNRNGGIPPGLFNIAPEKVVKMELPAVCLNYGKPNPRAAVRYEVKPISAAVDKPGVEQVCALLSDPTVDRTLVQLAAWHLSNDMSWEKLSGLRKRTAIGPKPRYSPETIKAAKKIADKAVKDAEEAKKGDSPTKA